MLQNPSQLLTEMKRLERALDMLDKTQDTRELIVDKKIYLTRIFSEKIVFQSDVKPIKKTSATNLPVVFARDYSDFKQNSREVPIGPDSLWNGVVAPTSEPYKIEREMASVDDFGPQCIYLGLVESRNSNQIKLNCGGVEKQFFFGSAAKQVLFNSRLYRRLGYNVTEVKKTPSVRIKYERRILSDFDKLNSPSSFADGFVLQDKTIVEASLVRAELTPYCRHSSGRCSVNDSLVNDKYEKKIESLILKNLAVFEKSQDHLFGYWNLKNSAVLDSASIKALMLLGALNGNHRLTDDNNSVVWSARNFEIKHVLNHLDGGFGRSLHHAEFDISHMPWQVIQVKNKGSENKIFTMTGFKPLSESGYFTDLKFAESRWMARLIAAVSEDELTTYLADAGFSASELLLAREKIISIQQNMVHSFELESEFANLLKRKIDRKISLADDSLPLILNLSSGKVISVDDTQYSLKNGILKKIIRKQKNEP